MNEKIKKFLKNPLLLFVTLGHRGFFNWMDDERYLKIVYRIQMGKKLNLDPPVTFNEKIQWLKLYDRKPKYTMMVDKYEAKKYVADLIGEQYIIPTLGVWNHFDEIDFDKLPNQFVLKCTHDSGGLIICRDKEKLDKEKARRKLENCLKHNFFWGMREWPYKDVKPRIIAEEYLEDTQTQKLIDYKFYCFHGNPMLLYVSEGLEDHFTAKISFLNMDWTRAPFFRSDYKDFEILPDRPREYDRMISVAETLSKGVPFIRVDLYEVRGKIYFSELTFSPCSGMMPFEPEEWDKKLGEWLKLP